MENASRPGRIAAIDVARGLALLAMASFHFTWDLEFVGYLATGTTAHGLLKLYARCIASAFLFLVGASLLLAHGRGIRWRGFWQREATVAGAAALISLGTFLVMRDEWIFFGILHQIALASLLGLLFLRLPPVLTIVAVGLAIAAPHFLRADIFNRPELWWVGLSTVLPRSNDYVPVLPWFGAVLLGIAAARLAGASGLLAWVARWRPRRLSPLAALGRHSLLFYLLHQPVLLGLVWLLAQVVPPTPENSEARFRNACAVSCGNVRSGQFCTRYCACMLESLEKDGMLATVLKGTSDEQSKARIEDAAGECTARTEGDALGDAPR